jgi:hypothetical protein
VAHAREVLVPRLPGAHLIGVEETETGEVLIAISALFQPAVTRYCRTLVESRATERNRLLNVLETANIKLSRVASNIFGASRADGDASSFSAGPPITPSAVRG